MSKGYTGWALAESERRRLLERFPPAYPMVVAEHVTHSFGVGPGHPLPRETEGHVVGIADDGRGVQALVVEIAGGTRRPDGSTFHVAWSLAPRRRPDEVGDVIRRRGWTAASGRHRIRLGPTPL